jgi:hypothetical protein
MNSDQAEVECCHTCGTAFRLPSARTCRVTVEDNLSAATPYTLRLAFCERCADDCERIDPNDEQMAACAQMCRTCAESCRGMAGSGRM